MGVAAGGVGVAVDVDDRLLIPVEDEATEFSVCRKPGLIGVLVDVEGDVRGHVEDDLVADARDADAGALELGAQVRLVPVHGRADRAAGQSADACADQHALRCAFLCRRQHAGQRAEAGAESRRRPPCWKPSARRYRDRSCRRRQAPRPPERRSVSSSSGVPSPNTLARQCVTPLRSLLYHEMRQKADGGPAQAA